MRDSATTAARARVAQTFVSVPDTDDRGVAAYYALSARAILRASEQGPAVRAIVVDAATDAGRSLYAKFGFVAAPSRADRMLVRADA